MCLASLPFINLNNLIKNLFSSSNTSEADEYRDSADEFHIKEPKAWISSHYQAVSRVLVIIVFLFFAILAIFYANLQTESQFDLIIKGNYNFKILRKNVISLNFCKCVLNRK